MGAAVTPEGERVARAKHTQRAEARRRYRATQVELGEGPDDEELDATEGADARATARVPRKILDSTATGGSAAVSNRPPGITSAFRSAARPVNVREDLARLPELIRHRAVWIPVLATAASGVALVALGSTNQIVNIVAQVFVVPPPMAASFLAGLLAPRASYMAGGIAGLWSAIVFAFVVFAIPADQALQITIDDRFGVALYAFVVSPLFGIAVGGFAGYYRRFLALSGGSRRRADQARRNASAKPLPRRR